MIGFNPDTKQIEKFEGKVKDTSFDGFSNNILTDIKTTIGYSGSPLFNNNGEVLGILSKLDDNGNGVFFDMNFVKEQTSAF